MKRWLGICILAVLYLFQGGMADAAMNRAGAFTWTPTIGGYVFEGNQDLDHSLAYGLGFGYNFTESFTGELSATYIDAETDTSPSVDVEGLLYRLDALYHLPWAERLMPFVAAGIGGLTLDPKDASRDEFFAVNYGAGFKYFLNPDFALRTEVRHVIPFNETRHNLLYQAAISWLVGAQKPAPVSDRDGDGVPDAIDRCANTPRGAEVDEYGCPLDRDGDGVLDYLDKCPNTPKGVKVDNEGCPMDADKDGVADNEDRCPDTPIGVQVDRRGCPNDSDGDGVYDYLDKCPDTPQGLAVDRYGCPPDSDGDGVLDHLDKCPDTAKGIIVDKNGCPLSLTLHIQFDTNRADIKPEHHAKLAKAAEFIRQYEGYKMLIAGHTDSQGKAAYNETLSLRRAEAVRDYLVQQHGIAGDKLVARGYGESQPIADNATAEGRRENRRVEIICCTIIPAE